jgi:beta-glucosidase
MPKKTSKKRTKKTPKPGLLTNKKTLVLIVIAFLTILYVYLPKSEDLGAQLPPPPADAIYKQPTRSIDERVTDLLSRMTLEEKIGQMALVDKNSLKKTDDISKYYLGGILSGAGAKPANNTPAGWQEMVENLKQTSKNSRLEIPILYGIDANHGHANVLGATVFPHAIGLGATRNPELVKQVAEVTAKELEATGINWSFSPSLDAPTDIRWGRVYEAFSDDPTLNATLGSAYIVGTQSASPDNSKINLLASAKHYFGTGSMLWGKSNHKKFKIDQGMINVDEQKLNQEFLPPYKSAIDAGVASVMVGLSMYGEERIIDSKYLLTDKLKNELGFKGFVVSDWYGVYEYSKTSAYKANIKAINAGLDMAMLPYDYKDFIFDVRKAIQKNETSQNRIDDAVSRILYQKFKAGLFDKSEDKISAEVVGSKEHRELARKAVAESAVLLQNNNQALPISKNAKHILVAGSGADNVGRQSGAWTVEWQGVDGNWMPGGTSILSGIKAGVSKSTKVDFNKDAKFETQQKKAEIGIAIVSEKPYAEGWGDKPNPEIEKTDLEAIERLRSVSEKVVVVVISGRPLLLPGQYTDWDGIVAVWLPGSEGAGVADVLFGDKPFSAKLPVFWPASSVQLPISSNGSTADGTKVLFPRYYGL